MKRNFYLFTVMAALFMLTIPSLRAQEDNKCGDNVTWSLDDDGVLTISGTGAMSDYSPYDAAPWKDLSVTSAVIGDGVTTIGAYAFYKCYGLTSVTIPNSVTSLVKFAFAQCEALTSVTIPSSVTSIGLRTFADCTSLAKIVSLAETPPDCGNYAFNNVDMNNCALSVPEKSLEAYKASGQWGTFVNIDGSAKEPATGTCGDNITWTLDSDGLLTIKGTGAMTDYEYSPWDGMDVKKIVIGDGITTIGEYAFIGCTGLTSVEIPNSVTSIGKAAIGNCTGLTSITIPSSVTNIGYSAFNGCTGLEKIVSLAQTPPACEAYVFYNVDINKCVLSVPEASIEKYKEADQWKDFYNGITGIDGVAEESNVGVSASNGVITVTGAAANTVVEVYSISGTLVYSGVSNTVAVPSAGVYIVKAAGKTVKVNAAR